MQGLLGLGPLVSNCITLFISKRVLLYVCKSSHQGNIKETRTSDVKLLLHCQNQTIIYQYLFANLVTFSSLMDKGI